MRVLGSLPPTSTTAHLSLAHILPPTFPPCPKKSGLRDGRARMRHFTTLSRIAPRCPCWSLALQPHAARLSLLPWRLPDALRRPWLRGKASPICLLFFLQLYLQKLCAEKPSPSSPTLFSPFCFLPGVSAQHTKYRHKTGGGEHLALAAEHRQGVDLLETK